MVLQKNQSGGDSETIEKLSRCGEVVTFRVNFNHFSNVPESLANRLSRGRSSDRKPLRLCSRPLDDRLIVIQFQKAGLVIQSFQSLPLAPGRGKVSLRRPLLRWPRGAPGLIATVEGSAAVSTGIGPVFDSGAGHLISPHLSGRVWQMRMPGTGFAPWTSTRRRSPNALPCRGGFCDWPITVDAARWQWRIHERAAGDQRGRY
jgi:hypothetical protein